MDFSEALRAMKQGAKLCRPSWIGWITVQVPDENSKMNRPYIYAVCEGGEVVPAVINQLDMMAEDWQIWSVKNEVA